MAGTPGNQRNFLIPEHSGSGSVQKTSIQSGDSAGDFASGHSASKVGDLSGNAVGNSSGILFAEEFVEELSSGSEDFSLVDGGSVFREQHLREVEHLVAENFVTVEVVTEQTSVRVREIVALVEGHVREVTEFLVNK